MNFKLAASMAAPRWFVVFGAEFFMIARFQSLIIATLLALYIVTTTWFCVMFKLYVDDEGKKLRQFSVCVHAARTHDSGDDDFDVHLRGTCIVVVHTVHGHNSDNGL